MRKKIFVQMVMLISVGILLVSIALCVVFYNQFSAQTRTDLQQRTNIFADEDSKGAYNTLQSVSPADMRISIIRSDGTVLFDNMADPNDLTSHLDREEIQEAFSFGKGESRRFSETLSSQTYYYAVKLTDGAALRTAKTIDSIWGMFARVLPWIVLIAVFFVAAGYFISGRLSKRTVAPIAKLDLESELDVPYDELAPYVRAIVEHRSRIASDSQELQRRNQTINAIMENMNEGMVLLNRYGSILAINKGAAKIFDIGESVEGKTVLELWRDIEFSDKVQKALEGGRSEMALSKSGKEYRVLISPVVNMGVIVFFLDITEKSKAEKMRREFSANVSHELKTPLTSIYGNAEMLKEGVVKTEDQPEFYAKIMNEAARLIALIDDIIMLSELDEGKLRKSLDEIDLADVAKECANALKQKADRHQVGVSVSGTGWIRANRSLIYEMFYNLIDNGIKYSNAGGTVRVEVSQSAGRVSVAVADSGIGIAPEDLGRMFERFYRSDKSRSKKSGGTGLGLAIVKHIILAHGGSINAASELGKGTRFEIAFDETDD